MKTPSRSRSGFTLVELMIAGGIAGVILTAVVIGGVVMQRMFWATTEYYEAQTNQSRILDYIARDLRRAQVLGPNADDLKAGSVSSNGRKLMIRMADYTDGQWPDSLKTASNGNAVPRVPVIETDTPEFGKTRARVYYGGKKPPPPPPLLPIPALSAAPPVPNNYVEVEYSTNGNNVIRKETLVRGGVSTSRELVISNDVESFELIATSAAAGSSNFDFPSQTATSVRSAVKFMPRFRRMQTQPAKDGTEVFSTTALRTKE